MTLVTEAQIFEALRSVRDPEQEQDIISLSLVKGLIIKDGNIGFSIEVEPKRGPYLEPLRKAAENAVYKLPGVTSVTAVLTAHKTNESGGESALSPAPKTPENSRMAKQVLAPEVKSIIAVASGKGGVGKSTTAINLAMSMARSGLSVGMLDADIYGPSIPRMMGITDKPSSKDGKVLQPLERYGLKCMSIGFLVPEDSPTIWRGPMVMSALEQMLRDVEWGQLDVMVVDMPPGTGDAQLTMSQRVPLAGAVIISTPQDIALLDARKGLNMFRKVDVPVLGIIENMSTFICPNCGSQNDIFGHGGARKEADNLGVDFLGEIPLHIDIRQTSDAGTPIVVKQPDGPHAGIYREIADKISLKIDSEKNFGRREAPRIKIS